jgi:hypothetical protein
MFPSLICTVITIVIFLMIAFLLKLWIESILRKRHLKSKDDYLNKAPKDALVHEIMDALNVYHNMAVTLHTTYVILGFIAIISSVLVTSLSGSSSEKVMFMGVDSKTATHILSFISTATITLITAFNLGTKSNNCRKAWRLLSYNLAQNRLGLVTDAMLLKAHNEAETIIGGVDFNYGHH